MKFIDTNVLLYAFGPEEDTDRSATARRAIAEGDLAFSVQVFQEFYVQATHSRRKDPLSPADAVAVLEALTAYPVQINDLSVFRDAVNIQQKFQTSFWDANILAAALALRCETVLSEDLNSGQDYGGLQVVNPFVGETRE